MALKNLTQNYERMLRLSDAGLLAEIQDWPAKSMEAETVWGKQRQRWEQEHSNIPFDKKFITVAEFLAELKKANRSLPPEELAMQRFLIRHEITMLSDEKAL